MAEAVPGRAIVAQHVEGYATNHGPVFRRVVAAGPAGILAELHVQDPVLVVFDPPMGADGHREPVPLRERAQEIAAFCTAVTSYPGKDTATGTTSETGTTPDPGTGTKMGIATSSFVPDVLLTFSGAAGQSHAQRVTVNPPDTPQINAQPAGGNA